MPNGGLLKRGANVQKYEHIQNGVSAVRMRLIASQQRRGFVTIP